MCLSVTEMLQNCNTVGTIELYLLAQQIEAQYSCNKPYPSALCRENNKADCLFSCSQINYDP